MIRAVHLQRILPVFNITPLLGCWLVGKQLREQLPEKLSVGFQQVSSRKVQILGNGGTLNTTNLHKRSVSDLIVQGVHMRSKIHV